MHQKIKQTYMLSGEDLTRWLDRTLPATQQHLPSRH